MPIWSAILVRQVMRQKSPKLVAPHTWYSRHGKSSSKQTLLVVCSSWMVVLSFYYGRLAFCSSAGCFRWGSSTLKFTRLFLSDRTRPASGSDSPPRTLHCFELPPASNCSWETIKPLKSYLFPGSAFIFANITLHLLPMSSHLSSILFFDGPTNDHRGNPICTSFPAWKDQEASEHSCWEAGCISSQQ